MRKKKEIAQLRAELTAAWEMAEWEAGRAVAAEAVLAKLAPDDHDKLLRQSRLFLSARAQS